jgi:phosphoglycolate phosphatase/putative hydrolase of the HAD superfamily
MNDLVDPRPSAVPSLAPHRPAPASAPIDWDSFDLVVFDVDGTLYDQRRLRLAMLRELLGHAWSSRSLATIRTLRSFREVREALGDEPVEDFLQQQYVRTAALHDCTPEAVEALASEWMEERPLKSIAACVYPHVHKVFDALAARGKQVAVFSDYPASGKLEAMGLNAAPVVCATDAVVARLKPDPRGLLMILARTGVSPQRALMIGDRFDRDAAAARRAGVRALIRSSKPHPDFATFRRYDDPLFAPLFEGVNVTAVA